MAVHKKWAHKGSLTRRANIVCRITPFTDYINILDQVGANLNSSYEHKIHPLNFPRYLMMTKLFMSHQNVAQALKRTPQTRQTSELPTENRSHLILCFGNTQVMPRGSTTETRGCSSCSRSGAESPLLECLACLRDGKERDSNAYCQGPCFHRHWQSHRDRKLE